MGRDIQAIKISREDRRRYRDKLRSSLDAFARMLRECMFDLNPSQVGQEIELNLDRPAPPCSTASRHASPPGHWRAATASCRPSWCPRLTA